MLKALLFDLDGTLSDTNSVHRLSWVEVLKPHGYDVTWDFYRENITGRVGTDVVRDLFPDFTPEQVREMEEAKETGFREQAGALEPFPGLLDLIESSRKKGWEISLVTNAPKENVLAVLQVLGLDEVFEPVILADDFGPAKPDPAPYNAALDALNISADEAVVFEDSPAGIASSVSANIPTVGIASTSAPEDLEGLGVELVVRDFADPRLEAFIEGR